MEDLVITQFGTIKGDELKEISIDSFLNSITKNINKYLVKVDDNFRRTINYKSKVYKINENKYEIKMARKKNNIITYLVDITDSSIHYPELKTKLDEFTEITKKHDYEENVVSNFDNNEEKYSYNNQKDMKIYLMSLKKLKGIVLSNIVEDLFFYYLITLCGPTGLFLLINDGADTFTLANLIQTIITVGGFGLMLVTGLAEIIDDGIEMFGLFKEIKELFRVRKLIKKKIKQLENKIDKTNEIVKELDKEEKIKDKYAIYKDNIINYMNSIMNATNRLNNSDRHKILLELRNILDEYTANVNSLSIKTDNNLILEDSERKNMMDTIKKLTTLEMEISEIMKRDEKSKVVNSESTDLRNQINASLQMTETIPSEKKQVRVRKI